MKTSRRQFLGTSLSILPSVSLLNFSETKRGPADPPTRCSYAPPGEYIKDHTFVIKDGWWHLFSISGTRGYYHGYNGNEETFSWSISKNLVDWEFRGHVMHPSQRPNTFDQHEVWAPFCLSANGKFFMFYTGIVHPHRPLEYKKLGHRHPWVAEGHKEKQGLALSEDLTDWVKVGDPINGLNIPGRDSCVVYDEDTNRWLLYSTGQGSEGKHDAYVSESDDLLEWRFIGTCARFPGLDVSLQYGHTIESWPGSKGWAGTTESLLIMRHPLTEKWIMMGNWHYVISDDATDFPESEVRLYDHLLHDPVIDAGFACEIIFFEGKWYRSGAMGSVDHWQLGFTEIEWIPDGAFRIVEPSILSVG